MSELGKVTEMHIGRSWEGTLLEDDCPCRKAPCGLVVWGSDPSCPEHGFQFTKSIRQGHDITHCPGLPA